MKVEVPQDEALGPLGHTKSMRTFWVIGRAKRQVCRWPRTVGFGDTAQLRSCSHLHTNWMASVSQEHWVVCSPCSPCRGLCLTLGACHGGDEQQRRDFPPEIFSSCGCQLVSSLCLGLSSTPAAGSGTRSRVSITPWPASPSLCSPGSGCPPAYLQPDLTHIGHPPTMPGD